MVVWKIELVGRGEYWAEGAGSTGPECQVQRRGAGVGVAVEGEGNI